MKIVFLLSLNMTRPGPSLHILTSLIKTLADEGHAVHIIEEQAPGEGALPQTLSGHRNISVDAVPVPAQEKGNFVKRYIAKSRYAARTGKYLARHKDADLVYVHSCNTQAIFAYLVRRVAKGAKLVLNVQDIFPLNAAAIGALKLGGLVYRITACLQRYGYRKADSVITLSEDMRLSLIEEGASADKTNVIALWSYSDDVEPIMDEDNRFLAMHPELKDFFRALYAGNIGTMQNVELILDAAALLLDEPRVRLVIVGGGARKAALEDQAVSRGLTNVLFYEAVPGEHAIDLYSMASVNLITLAPGVIKTAFPSKTTACFAVARPIIAAVDTDSQYARMVEACDKCSVVDPSSPEALAERILKNLQEGVGGLSEGARALYRQKFSQQAGTRQHVDLFKRLVRG